MDLKPLIDKSIYILRETRAQFENPAVLWSTGKDSTTCLSLCKEAFFGQIPFPVIHLDTGWKFEEIYEFRDRLARDWGFELKIARSPLAGKINPELGTPHFECCSKLKTKALRDIIEREGFDAVIVSIRRDEHYMRSIERVSSPRDKEFRWHHLRERKPGEEGDSPFVILQDVELWDILAKEFPEVHHVRRHPILHWNELEIWNYVKLRKLPINPLYLKGFRSLGCRTCTVPTRPPAASVDEIIAQLERSGKPERAGRAQDKEEEQIMRRLRALGYM